ncbi:ABC transporter ATP-binding protein [Polaromonas sp. P2-4]|nr:ABC transporter ATP-binding protein [Polaromonas sp. P2-4]
MCSDVAISVKNLTKTYRIFGNPGDRIKQVLTFGRMRFHREFTAVRDVSFEIKAGETVGIIGRNGSGKSTMLQLICGILKSSSGTVDVNGRISALLELGAGFNPEFTGRENVFFQGAVMNIAKEEMERRFVEIEAFADIGEFIDQPVRTYSSGMFVRLAFAVATHVEPDILVVDEALAVGDLAFQIKCINHMQRLVDSGVALLLVSHNMYHVRRLCRRCIYLHNGTVYRDGNADDVANAYESELLQSISAVGQPNSQHSDFKFCSVEIEGGSHQSEPAWQSVAMSSPFAVDITYQLTAPAKSGLQIGVVIKTSNGTNVFGMTTQFDRIFAPDTPGSHVVRVTFEPNILLPGIYGISVSAFDAAYKDQLGFWDPATHFEIAPSSSFNKLHAIGNVSLPHRLEFLNK